MLELDPPQPGTALYAQLVAYFREQIMDGSLPVGARLPPELELAQQHRISRNTVRQAMSTLVHEGLLERVQGRGTFVRQDARLSTAVEKRIGVTLTYSGDQLNMELLIGIDQAAKGRGYQVSFSYSEERATQQVRDVERLRADRVAGMIIFPLSNETDNAVVAQLQADNVPVVLVDRFLSERPTDYVVTDNWGGSYRATEHLLILGHTRIAFLYLAAADLRTTSVRDRWEGYRAALRDHGLPYDERLVFACPTQGMVAEDDAYLAIINRQDRPSAVCLVNDMQAPSLYKAARRMGLCVPDDLAVVGFDDLSFAVHLGPPLTTIAQPRMEIGIRAAHTLIDRIEGNAEPLRHIVLPATLVVRESCGARLRIQQSVGRASVGEG
jgi:GntR family transcriptional regulator, arabinose operon transcriptional repressor